MFAYQLIADHAKRLPNSLRLTASPRERLRRDHSVSRAAQCALMIERSLTIQHQRHGAWRQPALACRSGLRQGCYAHFPAAGPPGSSRSLVRTCIKELEAAGAAFLSSPPALLRWRGKFGFPRGLIALIALFAHHFFKLLGNWKASTCHHPGGLCSNVCLSPRYPRIRARL